MRKAAVGVIIALLVTASLGVGYLAVNPGRQSSTSISSQQASVSTSSVANSTASAAAISTTSSSGLELRIALNATTILPGQTLAANVTLFNTLDENLTLYTPQVEFGNSMIQSWDNYDFPCGEAGSASYLASFALLHGHFSALNFSRAPAPLQLAASEQLLCNGLIPPDKVAFLPNSSFAFMYSGTYLVDKKSVALDPATGSCAALPSGSSQCHKGTGLFGYWNVTAQTCCPGPTATNSQYFRYFTPGEYTLAAEDLWNQTVYAHFRVAQGPSPSLAVSAQESPFSNPRTPVIGLTLGNFGDLPIVSLNATLSFVPPDGLAGVPVPYPFAFEEVNSSVPLLPGETIHETRTLNGPLFDIGASYPLTIAGTLSNGTEFSYTQQIRFVNSVPSW
jgi:hypothetical protein